MTARLHRALLLAYPARFRARFAGDMQRMFEARWHEARRRSRAAALAFSLLALTDVVVSGLGERLVPHDLGPTPRRWPMTFENIASDLRFALRLMRRAPLFSVLSIAALGFGIGANGAIFAAVDNILLRPLPYDRPESLVMVWSDNTHEHHPRNPISPADFVDLKNRTQSSFASLEAMQSFLASDQFTDGSTADPVQTATVTTGMFRLLGRDAAIGQTFADGDRDGVILSDAFWHRRYNADRSVVGRHVNVSGTPRTIVGVMPADFVFPYRTMLGPSGFARAQAADMWLPMLMEGRFFRDSNGQLARQARFLGIIGRLQPQVTVDQARADVTRVTSQLAREFPSSNEGWSATLLSLHSQTVGALRPALVLLLSGVGLVLLMACVNLASLLLARSVARQRELTVRSALGASRQRIAQQLLIESLVLSIAGGVLAVALLYGGVQAIRAFAPPDTPRLNEIHPNVSVLLFMSAIAVVTGLVIGLFPAAMSSRTDVRAAIADSARGTTMGRGRRRLRAAFVVAEIGLAVVLTIGATLLLRSFVHVMTVDPGFRPDRLLTFQVNIPARLTTPDARVAYYDDLFARLERVPDVTAAGGTTRLPLGSTNVSTQVAIEGRDLSPAQYPEVEFRRALHHYFEAMGIPLLKGRLFDERDTPAADGVCILNRTAATRLFPADDPIGHRVRIGTSTSAPWLTIVGIVGDVRHGSLEEVPNPELYIFGRQNPPVSPFIALRTSGDPAVIAANVRSTMQSFEPLMPLFDLKAMTEIRRESVAERRFTLSLVGLFGALALVMAVFGVYGVMAIVVAERTTEVGIRLALGAPRLAIAKTILGNAARLTILGIVIGAAATMLLTPLMAGLLFGVSPTDPWSFLTVAAALFIAAVIAALIPARRAMMVDPILTMRG